MMAKSLDNLEERQSNLNADLADKTTAQNRQYIESQLEEMASIVENYRAAINQGPLINLLKIEQTLSLPR